MNDFLNKIMGVILIFASLLLPILFIFTNHEILLDYSFGFTMGAMMVSGVMLFS